VPALRREYETLLRTPPAQVAGESPLLAPDPPPLPRYFVGGGLAGSDLNAGDGKATPAELIRALNAQGWWPSELKATSNPYRGDGPAEPVPGDYRTTRVGDETDTSPYIADRPVIGISTADYIANMAKLIEALRSARR
jgi:hypothetical protein